MTNANTKAVENEKEVEEYIPHHLLDSHDFSLFSYTSDNGEHVYIGFPLPVILWDNGLNVFMSSKFHHGETIAKSGENYYFDKALVLKKICN